MVAFTVAVTVLVALFIVFPNPPPPSNCAEAELIERAAITTADSLKRFRFIKRDLIVVNFISLYLTKHMPIMLVQEFLLRGYNSACLLILRIDVFGDTPFTYSDDLPEQKRGNSLPLYIWYSGDNFQKLNLHGNRVPSCIVHAPIKS